MKNKFSVERQTANRAARAENKRCLLPPAKPIPPTPRRRPCPPGSSAGAKPPSEPATPAVATENPQKTPIFKANQSSSKNNVECPESPATKAASSIPESAIPLFKPSGRKPTGKIAELPRAQRDIINQMLENGATYDAVAEEMSKHGLSLNGENISNWYQSGFQQYLQHQDHIAEMRLLRENASDLVQDYNVVQFHQAANQLAVGRIFKALSEQELTQDPINYIRTLNALARLSRAALFLKENEDESAKAAAKPTQPAPPTDRETQRRLLIEAFEGATGVKAAAGPIGPDLNEYFARAKTPTQTTDEQPQQKSSDPLIAPAASAPIQKQKAKSPTTERCPQCSAPLPPLLPSGDRLYPHCQKCGTSLRPPGALIEHCPYCRYLLPELSPTGERPTTDCPSCNRQLPPPPTNSNTPAKLPPALPTAA